MAGVPCRARRECVSVIRRITSDAALVALASEWAALWRAAPATPFAHPAWLLPWWRQFGTGRPHVAVRDDAVLALYEYQGRLLPIGAGTTDTCDMLGTDPAPLLAALLDDRPAELLAVPPTSPLRAVTVPPGWAIAWQDADTCPALPLPSTMDALLATVPAMARKLRMNQNRAARAGGITIRTATPDTLADDMATLIRLHQARWLAQGEAGTLSDPFVLAFHADSAPLLLRAGLLRVGVLAVDGAAAAAIYALLSPGRIHFYLSGFDAVLAFVSPGSLLLAAMLEQAIGEGRHEADFLRGREAYKYAWGAIDRISAQARIMPVL